MMPCMNPYSVKAVSPDYKHHAPTPKQGQLGALGQGDQSRYHLKVVNAGQCKPNMNTVTSTDVAKKDKDFVDRYLDRQT